MSVSLTSNVNQNSLSSVNSSYRNFTSLCYWCIYPYVHKQQFTKIPFVLHLLVITTCTFQEAKCYFHLYSDVWIIWVKNVSFI